MLFRSLPEATRVIKEIQNHEYSKINASFHDCKTTTEGRKINSLSKKGMTVLSNTLAVDVLHLTHSNPDVLGVTIIDTQNRVEGYISSRKLTEIFGGKYGYSLNQNKLIKDVMETDFLCVSENLSVEETSRLTMSRNEDTLYDPVVLIRNNGFYAGIVIIKDLLESLIEIEVKQRTTEIKKINSNLSVAMEELKKNSIRAEKDLSMATQVQKNMYPHTAPQTTEWDCSFYFKPMSSVSGDVYDFYLSENHLDGVCLFDVSGHGISSALVGILAKSLASRIFIKNANQPLDKIITEINTRFIEEKGDAENYLTGVLIRMKENYIEYVNAGHPDVLLRKKDSTNKHNAAAITDTNGGDSFKGRFLGIPDLPTSYETLSIPVAHDDSILIYSDCLIESCNTKGEQFGISRLTSVFENSSATLSKDILEDIIKYFSSYTKGKMVSDDLTILICRRK